jgi:hypothetical protein
MLAHFSPLQFDAGMPRACRNDVFHARPTATLLENGRVRIAFVLATPTDVRVDVLDAAKNVVRHLGAAMLGGQTPQPFQSGTLSQTLEWDGSDDAGHPATGAPFSVRVSAGTQPVFDRMSSGATRDGWRLFMLWLSGRTATCLFIGRAASPFWIEMAPTGARSLRLRPACPRADYRGLKPVRLADGSVYFSDEYQWPGKKRYVGSMAITPQGQLLLPSPGPYPRRLTRIGLDGSVSENAFDTRLTRLPDVGYLHLASCPDGKFLYMAGAEAGYRGDDAREAVWRQAIYRLRLDGHGPAEIWIGDDENWSARTGTCMVNRPKGVATDARRQRVCLQLRRRHTIAVYSPGGGPAAQCFRKASFTGVRASAQPANCTSWPANRLDIGCTATISSRHCLNARLCSGLDAHGRERGDSFLWN